jgi:hypothetical protein
MFLSKIWFVLVGLLAGVAVTAAFVAPRPADRRIEQLEGQRLDRAQYAAEQMLKNDARRWIDYVAKLGRDRHLTEALDSSSRGAGEPKALHETVRSRLKALVPDPAAIGVESLIAVDNKGRVVARVGDDEGEYGESIAGAEVVGDALRGYMSDDVWGAAGRLRGVGAAPVMSKSRERIVGAVVVAVDTGKRLSGIWKHNLGVDVAIVLGKNVVSSTLPEALLGQLPELIEQHATEIANHKRSRALVLHMGNERMLLVAAPFVGEASEQRAYYVLLNKQSNSAGSDGRGVAEVDDAVVIEFGEFQRRQTGTKKTAKDTAAGWVEDIGFQYPKLTHAGAKVAALLGNMFGIGRLIRGRPESALVDAHVKVIHPPITNPETGVTTMVDEWDQTTFIGIVRFDGWSFLEPWTMVPGKWTIQLFHADRKLVEQTFEVVRP